MHLSLSSVVLLLALGLSACAPDTPPPTQAPVPAPAPVPAQAPAEPAAFSAAAPPLFLARTRHWSAPPAMALKPEAAYRAKVTLAKGGTFTVELFAKEAPLAVNNFVFLARQGFYDGTTFHRVLDGFMAQGGDPTGTGTGGPGYAFPNERSPRSFDRAGLLAMANAGRDTNGSQFFITFGPARHLDGGFSLFGQVVEGMEVVEKLTRRDPDMAPAFPGDAIRSVEIEEKFGK